jgi:RNA polymerase primary sigma factor
MQVQEEQMSKAIEDAWASLTYREREMLKLKLGLGDNYTFSDEEIGRMFGIGKERVRQILKQAARKWDAATSEWRAQLDARATVRAG